jgi:HEPN domain-containing protein
VEKLMKAVLIAHGAHVPRTHNLMHLNDLVRRSNPSWGCPKDDLEFLTWAGVAFRYPGEWAEGTHAERAMRICDELREKLVKLTGGGKQDSSGDT